MPELVCAADDPRWLDERRRGVTATDITAITGLSPYDSAYSLYFKKLGLIEDVREDSPRLRLGRDLEPIIRARWQETNHDYGYKGGLYRSSARSWQLATPDFVLAPDEPITAVLEVKSWADADRDNWTDGPPPRVRAQVLWQMDTLDVPAGHVGVLFLPSGEFRSYTIKHDQDTGQMGHPKAFCSVCADMELLRSAGEEFMARLRHELPPPSPDASTATLAALKARFTPAPAKEAEVDADDWEFFETEREQAAEHKAEALFYESKLRVQAGDAKYLTVAGERVATRVIVNAQVKAHTRHQDYIRRLGKESITDE